MFKTGTLFQNRCWLICVAAAFLVAACGQAPSGIESPSVTEAKGAASTPAAPPAATPSESLPAGPLPPAGAAATAPAQLTEGMAYADLRAFVLSKGWKPKVDAQCRANVVGGDFAQTCASAPDRCKVCDDLPELSSCSGDGHCLMNFERGADTLTVSTYGEIGDWKVSGKASGLAVKWWDPESAGK